MKSILKSTLIELLNKHRDNDVLVEFDGYELPIKSVYYHTLGDQIRITLDPTETRVIKTIIKENALRDKVGNAKDN